MPNTLRIRSYAKVNLYLDVLNRRRDGFHNIETIFQTVSLADELTFTEASCGIELCCSRPDLSTGPHNLVCRAAALLQSKTGSARGAVIRLEKNIPLAAGLAGGSGNAAATLEALNLLWDLGLSRGQLRAFGLELGSDVPYCLVGGAQGATGRGEHLFALPPLPETWCVLVHPPVQVSTAAVYNSPRLLRNAEHPFAGRTRMFRRALRALRAGDWEQAVFNRMEAPVFEQHPGLETVKRRLLNAGCAAAAMSGSGPTVFGLCESREAAERTAQSLKPYAVTVVKTVETGLSPVETVQC
ncbi:MAG TPA: 4-(cytidine 5'-diphospho)-2-C-methyl-D-erythritol kinase [Candidatus Hydrogenedentes bacterium]|nr:4-(cytidine 5'-diphospho)-2-C-methyl-D-erythritol kinase [Candidatus Hydrogenedentota bacterium]